MQNKKTSSNYLNHILYCSACEEHKTHKWFTVQKHFFFDKLAIQPVLYGKTIEDIQCFIPNDKDDPKAFKMLKLWNFEISICDACSYYELWKHRICITR